MNSQGTTCSLFTIYMTLVTLEEQFHIVACFFPYLAAHHQNKQEGKKERERVGREVGGTKEKRERKRDDMSNSIKV